MTIPLPHDEASRLPCDPRPSLTQIYGDHAGYLVKVSAAAEMLKAQRLMLQEDVDWHLSMAQASSVLQ